MNIYIIGIGNMGGAIAKVLAKRHRVFIYDKNSGKANIAGTVFDRGLKSLDKADFFIIAVKPQDIAGLSTQLHISRQTILISIAAGIKIAKIQKLFRHEKVIRMMPSLGLSVGQGIAGWKAKGLSAREKSNAAKLLNQITENFEVKKEPDIDAVTAISGSGPAYFFYFADALYRAAIQLGLDPDWARKLVKKTFLASAILQTDKDYQSLISQVKSKKGTTEAALKIFKKHRLDRIIEAAAKAAKQRAREIAND